MTWEKKNLVTQKDGSDTYHCSKCGHESIYFGLGGRSNDCPKCEKPEDIYGGWMHIDTIGRKMCHHCDGILIKVTEDHPNGKYLHLKRSDDEVLLCCPNNCGETTGKKPKRIQLKEKEN